MRRHGHLTLAATAILVACAGAEAPDAELALGPRDGHDLPAVDLDRIQPGDTAPDFALRSYAGDVVALSDFRGTHDVVLVFYRGHW